MNRFGLKGEFDYEVCSGDHVLYSGERNNLILDQGLDYVAIMPFAECARYCCIGIDNTAPDPSDVTLGTEVNRILVSSDYADTGFNRTTVDGSGLELARRFVFEDETGSSAWYYEIGFSPTSGSGDGLFSRALFDDSPAGIEIPIGANLRVNYRLTIHFHESGKDIVSPINFVDEDAEYRPQLFGLMGVNPSGDSYYYDDGSGCNEPSLRASIFFTDDDVSFAPLGSSNEVSSYSVRKLLTNGTYVSGNHFIEKSCLIFSDNVPTGFRAVGIGSSGNNFLSGHSALIKFDNYVNIPTDSGFKPKITYEWGRMT